MSMTPGAAVIDFAKLIRYEQLGGHGCATRVRLPGAGVDEFFVFKGMDFRTFLAHSADEGDGLIEHLIQGWRNSDKLLQAMPPHPNVLPPRRLWLLFASQMILPRLWFVVPSNHSTQAATSEIVLKGATQRANASLWS